ncbi:MAG: carbohydrate kinase family protein [Candidatus Lokiarchaeota archaeon]|nr:carbohydrate kinase family protein [Candidatus Lokiarchaeota archaeon]
MPGKKMVIVGEMNCDLFYKNEFFKQLEERVAERVGRAIATGIAADRAGLKKLVHEAIADLPKKNPGEARIKRGGNGNNSTELFGKLGVPIKLVSVTGTGSEWMKAELAAMGVDTSCIFQVPKTQPISTIIDDPTTTKIFTAANFKQEMNFSSIKLKKEDLADATIAFFTPMGAKFEPVLSMLQEMNAGITIAITVEIQAIDKLETLKQVVKNKVDMLFVNKADALNISGKQTIDEADQVLSHFAKIRFITLGAEGSLISSDFTAPVTLPVFKVKVADRTGAGDAFAGGVLLKCHELTEQGDNLVEHLKKASDEERRGNLKDLGMFGTAVAALKVSKGRTPSREEVGDFLLKNKL